jgi:hypothetical protein
LNNRRTAQIALSFNFLPLIRSVTPSIDPSPFSHSLTPSQS